MLATRYEGVWKNILVNVQCHGTWLGDFCVFGWKSKNDNYIDERILEFQRGRAPIVPEVARGPHQGMSGKEGSNTTSVTVKK